MNLPQPDYEADDILVVAETEQLRALADDVRLEIVALLRERAATTTELAGKIGLAKGTIAHHLKVLEAAALVKVVRTRQVRALTERFYGRVARLYVIKSTDEKPQERVRLSPADAESFQRRVERLLRDFRGSASAQGEEYELVGNHLPKRRFRVKLRRPGGLWLHRDFRNLWAAETVSVFGTQISQLALPLVAVITLEASVFEVALLGVIEFLPFILISLPAGVWVDRMRRKPILVGADVGRALLLASIPVAYWLDALTIWQMYVVGFGVGILTVFFDVSYQSYLPSLVERQQLVEGNSKLEISRSAAQLAGPGLAGLLVEAVKAPGAVLVDAVSFALSAFYLFRIKAEERAPTRAERQAGPGMKEEVKEGLRWVFGNRYLRWIAASTATFNFFGNIIGAVFLVYVVRVLGIRPGVIGLVFAVSSIGYLIGALAANRLSRRFGVGPTIILGAAGSVSLLLLAAAPASNPIPYLIAAQAISSMGIPIYNITQVSFRQAITPERLQGRMNSVMRFIVWGVMPVGALIGGALGSWFGLRTAIWVGVIGMSLAVLPVLLSPVRTLREMPEPVDEPLPSEAEAAGGLVPATAGTLPAAPPD